MIPELEMGQRVFVHDRFAVWMVLRDRSEPVQGFAAPALGQCDFTKVVGLVRQVPQEPPVADFETELNLLFLPAKRLHLTLDAPTQFPAFV